MATHSALTHHVIEFALRKKGKAVLDDLLRDVETPYDTLRSLRERLIYRDARRIYENYFLIFGEDMMRPMGIDFIEYFDRNRHLEEEFPLVATLRSLAPISKMDRETFNRLIGVGNQVNTAFDYRIVRFVPGSAAITIQKFPRHDSEGIKFRLDDQKYMDVTCKYHLGMLEGTLKMLKAEDLTLEEDFHQGTKVGENIIPYCQYSFTWKTDNIVMDDSMDYSDDNISIANDIAVMSFLYQHGLKDFHRRTIEYKYNGLSNDEIARMEGISVEAVKKRFEKVRRQLKVTSTKEAIDTMAKSGILTKKKPPTK